MDMDSFAVFCENVTILRTYYGYSKKQMAQLLGIGVGSLRKIESGEIPPRLKVDVIFMVCEQFHIRPSALFSYDLFPGDYKLGRSAIYKKTKAP